MKNDLKAKLIELAKGRGVDPSQYASDKELFQSLTGINVADEEFINAGKNLEWYVPGGAISVTTEYESGDVNLDGVVDATDVTEIEANKGTTDPTKIANYDINKDGAVDDADVELANSQIKVEEDEETEVESDSYDYIFDESSWNASYANGGLKIYYEWSDNVNKPYKEDLWNTVENRAANINDAKKDTETGEYELDDNGNYVYENCERSWQGAINASGAKYPWIVPYFDTDVNATITFQYEGKEDVQPWGDTVFGTGEGHKVFGCASIPTEFNDDSFLVNGDNEFDISKFKMILKTA